MTYKPGDTANGYVLGEDYQWHPLPVPPAPEASPAQPAADPYPPAYSPQPYTPVAEPSSATETTAFPQSYPPATGSPSPAGYRPAHAMAPGERSPRPPRPFWKAWWFWVGLAVVILAGLATVAILALRSITNDIKTVTTPTVRITAPATPKPTTAKPSDSSASGSSAAPSSSTGASGSGTASGGNTPLSGKTATDGNVQFTVTGIDCSKSSIGTPPLVKKSTKGAFCLVTVSMTNKGTKRFDFNPFYQEAVDAAGKTQYVDMAAMIFVDDGATFLDPVAPGATANGVLPFEVPSGTTLTSIELHEDFTSKGVTISLP